MTPRSPIASIALLLATCAVLADPPAAPKAESNIRTITPSLKVDLERKLVHLDGEIVLREGPLELLACPKQTKEHESIVACDVEPKTFQLALLLAGAKPGRPARFDPFSPPTGQTIRVWVEALHGDNRERIDARQWVRDVKSQKEMTADFVFAGSGFRKIPGIEQPAFLGDDGDLVCLANFPGAILDVAIESSDKNDHLTFDAFTDRIPPRGTKVRLTFEPMAEKGGDAAARPMAEK